MSTKTFSVIGNVSKVTELTQTENSQYCRIDLAHNQYYKNKEGESKTIVTWYSLTFWAKQADFVSKHISKSQKVFVSGNLSNKTLEISGIKYQTIDLIPNYIESLTAPKQQ